MDRARRGTGAPLTQRTRTATGLLGGSFNPAHGGHRSISLFAARSLALDAFWWLVSPGNPLKADANDMAPPTARLASAQAMARRSIVKATAIEAQLGTRYTVDTIRALVRRYPRRRFIWVMGADNLAEFHRWHRWRDIARAVPIAVVTRPGYDGKAMASPAMVWLRRFVLPPGQQRKWTRRSAPTLILLSHRPDPRSATALRLANPDWHRATPARVPDPVTHRTHRHPDLQEEPL